MPVQEITRPTSDHISEPLKISGEISVTGKWVPRSPGGLFRKSSDADDLLKEWEDIHADARADQGVEPPRVYWRVKHSKGGPYDTEKTHADLHG
jgi:hypothetical protein